MANKEHVKRLRSGVTKWNKWRYDSEVRRNNQMCPDLRFADLSSAELTDANLVRANLRFADLSGANLSYLQRSCCQESRF